MDLLWLFSERSGCTRIILTQQQTRQSATNKAIDLFFQWFNVNYTRTNDISSLGSAIIVVLGSNMSSVPPGLEAKLQTANFSVILAHGSMDTDYTVPTNLMRLYGVQPDRTYPQLDTYGNVYSDEFQYEISYRWNSTGAERRNLVVDASIADTIFWYSRWGGINKRVPAVVKLRNNTRFFVQVPIFVSGSQLAGLDRWFIDYPLRTKETNHFTNIYEISVMFWIIQHYIALSTLAKGGTDAAFTLRLDDIGLTGVNDINNLQNFTIRHVNMTLAHIAKFQSIETMNAVNNLVAQGSEIMSHGFNHSGADVYLLKNDTLFDIAWHNFHRKVYTKDIDSDPTDYEMWIDLDQDSIVDDNEWTNSSSWLFIPQVGGGMYIYVNSTTSSDVSLFYEVTGLGFANEFYSNVTRQESILADCLKVYNYVGFTPPGLKYTNDTYVAAINKGFLYVAMNWYGPYPSDVTYDRLGNTYNMIWMPTSSLAYPTSGYSYPATLDEYNRLLALVGLSGGIMVVGNHIGSWSNSKSNQDIVGNFTETNNVWGTTYQEAARYFKAMRKVQLTTYSDETIQVDLSRLNANEKNLLDGVLTIRFKNEKIITPFVSNKFIVGSVPYIKNTSAYIKMVNYSANAFTFTTHRYSGVTTTKICASPKGKPTLVTINNIPQIEGTTWTYNSSLNEVTITLNHTTSTFDVKLNWFMHQLIVDVFRNDIPTNANISLFDENMSEIETIQDVTHEWLLLEETYYSQAFITYNGYPYSSDRLKVNLNDFTRLAINFQFSNLTVFVTDIQNQPLAWAFMIFERETQTWPDVSDESGLATIEAYYGNWTISAFWEPVMVSESIVINDSRVEHTIKLNVGDVTINITDPQGRPIKCSVTITPTTYSYMSFSGDLNGTATTITFTQMPLINYTLTVESKYGTQTYTIDASQNTQISIETTYPATKWGEEATYFLIGTLTVALIAAATIFIFNKKRRKAKPPSTTQRVL